MIIPNRIRNCSPSFSLLSQSQIEEIHNAALDVLERVGVVFQSEKAVEILRSAGCKIEKDNLVKIPSHLVEEAVGLTPSSISVYNRIGELQMKLEADNVYFGAGGSCPYVAEIDGEQKSFTSEECAKNALVTDALKHIDFYMAMAHCSDVPAESRDVREIFTVLTNTIKPMIITSHTVKSLDVIVEMCGVISGSKEAFLSKPYIIYYTEPVSPLRHTAHSLDKLLTAADYGLPILNTPGPMSGGTAPITLVGTLLCGVCELLSGLVLVQNYKKGTPIIFGGVFTTLDMKGMIFTYGGPELQLMNTAIAQLTRFYDIPSFGTAGATDSHEIDAQAAFECGTSILLNALSGSNLVHDVGWMSSAQTTSNELLVLGDEIIGYTERYLSGIDTSRIQDSIKELAEVGPGGSFLDRDLTLELYRKEVWYPKIMTRISHKAWMDSEKVPLKQRLKNEVDRIVKEHQPTPIPDETQLRVIEMIETYEAELQKSSGQGA